MFWLIGTAFALRNFLTLTTLGAFTRVFRGNRYLLVFGGFGHLEKFRAQPAGKKKSEPKKIEKHVEIFIFRCGFKKCVFVKNGAFFFRFQPLVPPTGAVRTEKI